VTSHHFNNNQFCPPLILASKIHDFFLPGIEYGAVGTYLIRLIRVSPSVITTSYMGEWQRDGHAEEAYFVLRNKWELPEISYKKISQTCGKEQDILTWYRLVSEKHSKQNFPNHCLQNIVFIHTHNLPNFCTLHLLLLIQLAAEWPATHVVGLKCSHKTAPWVDFEKPIVVELVETPGAFYKHRFSLPSSRDYASGSHPVLSLNTLSLTCGLILSCVLHFRNQSVACLKQVFPLNLMSDEVGNWMQVTGSDRRVETITGQ
jgi:hypothetical protein